MHTNALKRPGKRRFPYFAFIHEGSQRLAVAFEARSMEDAWLTARSRTRPGQWVGSVVRLHRKDGATAKWIEDYQTVTPYPSN